MQRKFKKLSQYCIVSQKNKMMKLEESFLREYAKRLFNLKSLEGIKTNNLLKSLSTKLLLKNLKNKFSKS